MDQIKRAVYPTSPSWVSDNPYLDILAPRFFENPVQGDWADLPRRVVRMFIEVERRYVPEPEAVELAEKLHALLLDGAFLPNSPVMMNTEHEDTTNLFACHVLAPPVGADAMAIASKIHDGCGGIGYDLTLVEDPVAMTVLIEEQTAARNPNRKRKAHSAVTLHAAHPMVGPFIEMSSSLEITHTNVELDGSFFVALAEQEPREVQTWQSVCTSIYRTGRPAIAFGEHKSLRSPNGERLILNVCGESLLRENESSLIGSLNVSRFVNQGMFEHEKFVAAVDIAVRCLDNLHDIQDHASVAVAQRCMQSRKIGLSVMGFADALLMQGIRYGSGEALSFASAVMNLVQKKARATSESLAVTRGSCDPSLLPSEVPLRRNASLMAIAANGTLSLLANVSGGIEPIFSYVTRQIVDGCVINQIQPTLRRLLREHGVTEDAIRDVANSLMNGVDPEELQQIPSVISRAMVRAHDLSPTDHIKTQAVFQSFIDGGISKTINLPATATVEDIAAAILDARSSGCVGISLYRDGSVSGQPSQAVQVQSNQAGVVAA